MRAIFSATLGTGNDADRSGCYSTRVWSPTGKEIGSLPSLLKGRVHEFDDASADQAEKEGSAVNFVQLRAVVHKFVRHALDACLVVVEVALASTWEAATADTLFHTPSAWIFRLWIA